MHFVGDSHFPIVGITKCLRKRQVRLQFVEVPTYPTYPTYPPYTYMYREREERENK
jgi:hypothetical protein